MAAQQIGYGPAPAVQAANRHQIDRPKFNSPTWKEIATQLSEPRKNAERIAAIQQAISATQDQAVQETCVLIAHSLVALLATLRAQIDRFARRMAELVAGTSRGGVVWVFDWCGRSPGAADHCDFWDAAGALPKRL